MVGEVGTAAEGINSHPQARDNLSVLGEGYLPFPHSINHRYKKECV